VPVSSLGPESGEPAVDPSRFRPSDDPMYPGGWTLPPQSWAGLPEERLLAGETLRLVRDAIGRLPPRQQEVILLRDVEGWEPEEVVQEAWLGVVKGLHLFEGRSSLKGWIFRIVANCAKARGVREGRSVPLSSLEAEDEGEGPTVDADRFRHGDGVNGRSRCRSGPLPDRGAPPRRWLAARAERMADARGRASPGRDARRDPRGNRGAAGVPACRDHDARRRRLWDR